MEKKRCKVIRLASKDNAAPIDDQNQVGQGLSCNEVPNFHKYNPQHLYIVSDDEIKEGDWYINGMNEVSQFEVGVSSTAFYKEQGIPKIIATTNPELGIGKKIEITEDKVDNIIPNWKRLPQPSKAFIEKYCKAGGIDEVLVEYEYKYLRNPEFYGTGMENTKWLVPKVDSHNTITIHSIKDSWTREEVEKIAAKFFLLGFGESAEGRNAEILWQGEEKWLKEIFESHESLEKFVKENL